MAVKAETGQSMAEIAAQAVRDAVMQRVEGAIWTLASVPLPSGDHVFAPHPSDVAGANEVIDEGLTFLYPDSPEQQAETRSFMLREARRRMSQ